MSPDAITIEKDELNQFIGSEADEIANSTEKDETFDLGTGDDTITFNGVYGHDMVALNEGESLNLNITNGYTGSVSGNDVVLTTEKKYYATVKVDKDYIVDGHVLEDNGDFVKISILDKLTDVKYTNGVNTITLAEYNALDDKTGYEFKEGTLKFTLQTGLAHSTTYNSKMLFSTEALYNISDYAADWSDITVGPDSVHILLANSELRDAASESGYQYGHLVGAHPDYVTLTDLQVHEVINGTETENFTSTYLTAIQDSADTDCSVNENYYNSQTFNTVTLTGYANTDNGAGVYVNGSDTELDKEVFDVVTSDEQTSYTSTRLNERITSKGGDEVINFDLSNNNRLGEDTIVLTPNADQNLTLNFTNSSNSNQVKWERINNEDGSVDIKITTRGYYTYGYGKRVETPTDIEVPNYYPESGLTYYKRQITDYLYDYETNEWVLSNSFVSDNYYPIPEGQEQTHYGLAYVTLDGKFERFYSTSSYNSSYYYTTTDLHDNFNYYIGTSSGYLDYDTVVNTIIIKDIGREDITGTIKIQTGSSYTTVNDLLSYNYTLGTIDTSEDEMLQGSFLDETFNLGYGNDTVNTVGGNNRINLVNGGKDIITLGEGADIVDVTFSQGQTQGHYEDLGYNTVATGGAYIYGGTSDDKLLLDYGSHYFYRDDSDNLIIIQNYQYGSFRNSKITVDDYFISENKINIITNNYYNESYQVSNGDAIFYNNYIYTNKNGYFLDKEGNVYIRTFGYNNTEQHYENTYTPVMQNSDSKYNQLGLTKEECVSITNSNAPDENGYYSWVKNDTTYYFKYNSETEEYNIYTKNGDTYTQYTEQKNVNYAIDTVFTTNVAFVKNADGYINTIYNDYYLDENGNVYTRTSQYDSNLGKTVYTYQPLMQDSTIFYNQIGLTYSMYNALPEEDGYRKYETEDGTYYVDYNYGHYNIYTKENDSYTQLTEQKNINYPMYVSINTWHEGGYYHWWDEDMELIPALSTVGSYVEGEGNVNGTNVNEALVANNQAEITTGEGDDKIYTSSASDTITIDGSGNKEIFISNNSGNDVIDIQNNEATTYLMGGYKEMHKLGDDLVLHRTINSQGDIGTTTIKNYFKDEFADKKAKIYISNNNSTKVLQIDNLYIDADPDNEHNFTGTPYVDIINGTKEVDTITVGDTDDYNYSDTITPGKGDDIINITGYGRKSLYFAKGDGNDIINLSEDALVDSYYNSLQLNYTDRNEGNSHIIDENGDLILYRTYVDNGGDDIHTDSIKITGIKNRDGSAADISAINEDNIATYSAGLNVSREIQFIGKHWTQMSDSHSSTADYTEEFAANNPIFKQGETDSANNITVNKRSNLVIGGSQKDTISATGEINHVYSAVGDDSITVDSSVSSVVYAGSGDDIITVRGHKLNEEDTSITSIANIYTQAGNDVVNVESGMANIYLAGGNDTVNIKGGTGGTINFTAGGGNKTINFIGASDARYDFNFYGYEDMDRANTSNMEYDYYHFTKNGNKLIIDAKYHEYINGNYEYHFETHTINNYFSASDAKIDPEILYSSYYLRDSLYNYDGEERIKYLPLNADGYYDEERNVTIFDGTPFSDIINGTDGVDIISTGEGSEETITGGKGDDIINLDGKNYRRVIVKKGDGNDVIDISKAFTDGDGSLNIGDRVDEKFESSYRIDGNDLVLYRTYNEGDNFHTDSVRITGIDNSYRKVTKYPLGLTQEACKTIAESQQPNENGYYEWGTDNTTYCFKYDDSRCEYSYYIKNEDGTYTTISSYYDCPQKFRDAISTIRQIQQPDEDGYYSWKDNNTYYFKYDTYYKQYYMYTRNEYAYTYVNYAERPSYLRYSSILNRLHDYQLPDNDGYYKWEDNDTYYLKYNTTSGEYDVFTKNDNGEYVPSTDYPSYFTNNVRSTIVNYISSNDDDYYVFGGGTGKTYYFEYDDTDLYTRSEIKITAENIANYDGGLNASGNIYIYDQYNQNYNTFSSRAFDASMKQHYQGNTNTANTMSTEENTNNLILGGDKNDTITANGGEDRIYAGAGNDSINVNVSENSIIDAGTGNDTININSGTNNDIYSGLGNDVININGGSGTINLVAGTGNDTITFLQALDGVYNIKTSGYYTYSCSKSGNDLVINCAYSDSNDNSVTESHTIKDIFGAHPVELDTVKINDNALSSALSQLSISGIYDGKTKRTIFTGTNYNDNIEGTEGVDVITTGSGYDTIRGGKGNDTITINGSDNKYILSSKGDGSDTLVFEKSLTDRCRIYLDRYDNINTPIVSKNGSDLLLKYTYKNDKNQNIGETLTLKNYFNLSDTEQDNIIINNNRVDNILTENVSVMNITGKYNNTTKATELFGTRFNDIFIGTAGNDIITTAGNSDDQIFAGKGDDKIIFNGSGNKVVNIANGDGNDTFQWNGSSSAVANLVFDCGDIISYQKDKTSLVITRNYSSGKKLKAETTKILDYFNSNGSVADSAKEKLYVNGSMFDINTSFKKVLGKSNKVNKKNLSGNYVLFTGGSKNDVITSSIKNAAISSGAGNDKIKINSGNASVTAGYGKDNITLNTKGEVQINHFSGDGNDTITFGKKGPKSVILNVNTPAFNKDKLSTLTYDLIAGKFNFRKSGKNLLIDIPKSASKSTKYETLTFKNYFKSSVNKHNSLKIRLGNYNTFGVNDILSNGLDGVSGMLINGTKKKKLTTYNGISNYSNKYIYKGNGRAVINGGKKSDSYITTITSKSNLTIKDKGSANGSVDSLYLNANRNNLRAFFNVDKKGQVKVNKNSNSDNFFIFNKGSLTAANLKNVLAGKTTSKGFISIDKFFDKAGKPNGKGLIEEFCAGSNLSNQIYSGNKPEKIYNGDWVAEVSSQVASWLSSYKSGAYNTALDVINSKNTTDINAMLKVYNNVVYHDLMT